MGELTTPDGSLKIGWYIWRTSHDIFDADTYWRVDVANAETGRLLASRSYSRAYSRMTGHESGADVAGCSVSEDSRTLTIRLSDGSTETVDLAELDRLPRHDSSSDRAHGLRWTPIEPGGAEVVVSDFTYGDLRRALLVPPRSGNASVRRIAFSGHPGLIAVVRDSGEMEHLRYPHESPARALDWSKPHPAGWLLVHGRTAHMGPMGDEGEMRTSVAAHDALTRELVSLNVEDHARQLGEISCESGFDLVLRFEDGTTAKRSLLDGLLPFGALTASADGARLLRVATRVDDRARDKAEHVRWTQLDLIDAHDARTLGSTVVVCPYRAEQWGTLTISHTRATPDGARHSVEQPVRSARFGDEDDEVAVTLADGSEQTFRLGGPD